jgi:hypothetical protein
MAITCIAQTTETSAHEEKRMSTQYTNVIVYLPGPIAPAKRAEIEQLVAAVPGVGRAAASTRAERLILVDYDPRATSAQQILGCVRGRGVSAQLVGM